jgi:hypothetical protein
MTAVDVHGNGTKEMPWQLKTPSGTSEYQMYRDEAADPPALVCTVGTTVLRYQLRCLDDLHAMLEMHGDWMLLGSADEQKPAAEGTVEAWARSDGNPVGGWYGMKKGLRGRFGMYVPPLMEALGLAEVEHNPSRLTHKLEIGTPRPAVSAICSTRPARVAGRFAW